jgi:hypothetical protein
MTTRFGEASRKYHALHTRAESIWSRIANKVFGRVHCYGIIVTMEYLTYMGLWNCIYTL